MLDLFSSIPELKNIRLPFCNPKIRDTSVPIFIISRNWGHWIPNLASPFLESYIYFRSFTKMGIYLNFP